MVLTSTCNGFDGKIESTHRAALVLEEPMTQYGWARLGIESINLHKRGWRSHPLPVLLILSIPMAWAARCVLSNRVQKAHPPTIGRVIQILPLSNIYITTAVTDRNHTVCQGHSKKAIKQESVQAWWQVASRGHFPLLFVSSGSPAAQAPQQIGGANRAYARRAWFKLGVTCCAGPSANGWHTRACTRRASQWFFEGA